MASMEFPTLAGFRVQARVLGALIMREVYVRFDRSNIGFLWIFVEPIMFIGGVVTLRGMLEMGIQQHGVSIGEVMFTGYPPLVMWRAAVLRNSNSIRGSAMLMYHRRVRPVDVAMTRILFESAGTIAAYSVCYVVMAGFGEVHSPVYWSYFILGWVLNFWYSIGCGLLIAALSELTDIIDRVVHVFAYLWLPFCGAFYIVEWLPMKWRTLALYLPSVQIYEFMRFGYFGPVTHFYWNLGYLFLVLAGLTILGLGGLKMAHRKMV
jgi:capsular polysaccharide transport system permease protein